MSPSMVEQERAERECGYGPIKLKRHGNTVSVYAQTRGGDWVEVISESKDSNFDHAVYPVAILEAFESA